MPESKLNLALDWKQKLADANRLIEEKEYKRALVSLDDALQMAENLTGPEDLRIAETLERIAFSYHSLGCLQDAEPLYRRAIELSVPRIFGMETEELATANLANLLCETNRAAEGEALRDAIDKKYPKSVESGVQTNVSNTYRATPENDIMRSLNGLARSNPGLATPVMNDVLGLIETVYGADSLEVVDALDNMGNSSEIEAGIHERLLRIQLKKLGNSDTDEATIAHSMRNLSLTHPDKTLGKALLAKARFIEKKLGISNVLDMTMEMLRSKLGGGAPAPPEMEIAEAEKIIDRWIEQAPEAPPFVEMSITSEQRQQQLLAVLERALAAVFEIEKDTEYPLSTICLLSAASRIHEQFGDIEQARAMLEKEMEIIGKHWGEGHSMMVDTYERYHELGSRL